jgi:hypothetical protein
MARLAQSLVSPAGLTGFACTVTRAVVADYDPISGVVFPPIVTSWPGTGMWAKTGTTPTLAVSTDTPRRVITRTLLMPGRSMTMRPMPGDVVTVDGFAYTVGDVTHVGDADGTTPPLYRVTVSA